MMLLIKHWCVGARSRIAGCCGRAIARAAGRLCTFVSLFRMPGASATAHRRPRASPLTVQEGPRRAAALLELLADYTAAAPAASAAAAVTTACAPGLRRAAAALARAGPPAGWPAPAAALLTAWLRLLAMLCDRCQARRPRGDKMWENLQAQAGLVLGRRP